MLAAREPLRRVASRTALAAAGLAIIGGGATCIDLATRPPCSAGYVRLIDLEPAVAIVGFALAGLALVVFWRSRHGSHLKLMTAVSAVVLVGAALLCLGAVATLVHHYGQSIDDACWTF
jgi:hypothetical protein